MQQIGSVIVLVALVATGVFLISEKSSTAPTTPPSDSVSVPFTELMRGEQAQMSRRVNYLITSEEGLIELWKMLGTEKDMPNVDFNTRSVVAVFAGEKMTGGYSIAVTKIEDSLSSRTVSVALTMPGEGCMSTQVITTPFQIIELPSTDLEFTHEDIRVAVACK